MNPHDKAYPNRPEWLTRPARRQVDEGTLRRELQSQGGPGERNIWSGRSTAPPPPRSNDPKDRKRELSKFRCHMELDVGKTRGSEAKQHVFCIYFAKGCCSQGSACPYLHRLPTAEDEAYAVRDLGADIFGREKRGENEGYRKGAGTLERDNRTVFVSYEGAGGYELPRIRQLLEANFNAFGPVNNIYIKHVHTIAFVRYDWRSSAEFAKEAMQKQGLLGSKLGEVLTTRWANEDPNPVAIVAVKRAAKEAFGAVLESAWENLPPEQKQARIQSLQMAAALHKGQSVGYYPSTDDQFAEQERLRQQQRAAQQQAAAAAAAGGGSEYDDWEPYIPTEEDVERAQRLEEERQRQQLAAETIPGVADPDATLPGAGGTSLVAAGGPGVKLSSKVMGGAVEPAVLDPRDAVEEAQREQLEANPVYASAYQAHLNAYRAVAGGYAAGQRGAAARAQGEEPAAGQEGGQQEGAWAQYGPEYYQQWYAQYGYYDHDGQWVWYPGYEGYGQQQEQGQQEQQGVEAGGSGSGGQEGAGGEGAGAKGKEGGEEGAGEDGKGGNALALLGAYSSDEEGGEV